MELFDILQRTHDEEGIDLPQFLGSHPDSKNRKDHMSKIADSRGWVSGGIIKPIPARILEMIAADKRRTKKHSRTSENG
jgi:hypothetical protein